MFCQVSEGIADALRVSTTAHELAVAVCAKHGINISDSNAQVTLRLLEQFPNEAASVSKDSLEAMLTKRDYVPRKMKAHAKESSLFIQPAGLLAYWLVDRLGGEIC